MQTLWTANVSSSSQETRKSKIPLQAITPIYARQETSLSVRYKQIDKKQYRQPLINNKSNQLANHSLIRIGKVNENGEGQINVDFEKNNALQRVSMKKLGLVVSHIVTLLKGGG